MLKINSTKIPGMLSPILYQQQKMQKLWRIDMSTSLSCGEVSKATKKNLAANM